MSKKRSNSPTRTTSAIARLGLISTEIRDRARLEAIAAHIQIPLHKWPGNCYNVASALCESGLLDAEPQYGHWRGPVAPDTKFYDRWLSLGGWTNHGWSVLNKSVKGKKLYCDPTRYVFEGVNPYIFLGPDPHGYYDLGGDTLRSQMDRPAPERNLKEVQVPLTLPPDVVFWLSGLVEDYDGVLSLNQVVWLGNMSMRSLGKHAAVIYRALIDAGFRAVIPLDNREVVLSKAAKKR